MVGLEIVLALIAGAIGVSFLFLAWVWIMTAIFGLVRALLRAPFSHEARADLVALRFLRHPFFIFGPRAPTAKMRDLALRVAQERGIALPLTTLRSFYRTRRFLNEHSRDWLPPRGW
ncbi:TPA: hypothetical protein QDB15_000109 [Burkholderia vietnamiensis]|uniref:Uncharacterized protein n=1 Tax=Pandoraea apista TaxID=93218 RepID=A0A5E5P100_9BURK|nr:MULTISPECIES: hypothetical protein [Burkholderiaceae]MCA8206383.1 hypothetical protein [Burkholderia vietnamiensis]VVG70346.1 hypothetical protein PAP18089_01306 [Pandoraea apista]HDR8943181.1 hypothetical protein [Burkholderia vietnamiensis]HDR9116385.1 hypothetical protein [Burkholderia vietnamiensis]HDR9205431.1 hypothetical protein [Burkholderia vietnamiensis]